MKKTQFEPRLTKQRQHVYYHWYEGKKNKQKQNITKQKTRKKAGGIRD